MEQRRAWRTKESEMMVLRPAVILKVVEGRMAGCWRSQDGLAAVSRLCWIGVYALWYPRSLYR